MAIDINITPITRNISLEVITTPRVVDIVAYRSATNTDQLPEGNNNLYFTNERVIAAVPPIPDNIAVTDADNNFTTGQTITVPANNNAISLSEYGRIHWNGGAGTDITGWSSRIAFRIGSTEIARFENGTGLKLQAATDKFIGNKLQSISGTLALSDGNQGLIINANNFYCPITNYISLGTDGLRFKNLFLSGDANIAGNVGIGTTIPTHGLSIGSNKFLDNGIVGYSTVDQTTNYQRLNIYSNAVNVVSYDIQSAGTGATGYHSWKIKGTTIMEVDAAQSIFYGNLFSSPDNTKTLGRLSGSPFRFKDAYFGTGLQVGAAANTAIAATGHFVGKDSTSSNFVGKFQNSSSIDILSIRNDGNVGIGTASPIEKLHVIGNIEISAGSKLKSTTRTSILMDNPANASMIFNTLYQDAGIGGYTFNTANTTRVRIDGNGNVGIGTASPYYQFEVKTSLNGSRIGIDDGSSGNEVGLYFNRWTGSPDEYYGYRINGYLGDLRFQTSSPTSLGEHTYTDVMSLTQTGNLGIGTTSPTRALDVRANSSTIIANFNNSTGTSSFISLGNSVSTADQIRLGTSSNDFTISTNYAERLRINNIGNVGIGTTSPAAKVEIRDTADTVLRIVKTGISVLDLKVATGSSDISSSNSNDLTFTTSSTERLRINTIGNVGIGTTSPEYPLDVRGGDGNAFLRFMGTAVAGGDEGIGFADTANNLNWAFGRRNTANTFEITYNNGSVAPTLRSGNLLSILSTGNVGIGTTSPSSKLHIKQGSNDFAGGVRLENAAGSASSFMYTDTNGGLRIDTISSGAFPILLNSAGGGGKVGIGTTSPASKLQVNGGVQMADDTDTASATKVGTLRYRSDANNSYVDMCMQTGASTYAWVNITANTW